MPRPLGRRTVGTVALALLLALVASGCAYIGRAGQPLTGIESDGSVSLGPQMTPDGRFVAFTSQAANLVPGDANGVADAFVHDRTTGVTERANLGASGVEANGVTVDEPDLSSDGRFVTFASRATNLDADCTNGVLHAFVRDRRTDTTDCLSVSTAGVEGAGDSNRPKISGDGRFVVFESESDNLVGADTNGTQDVFVRDRQAGTTQRVSVTSTEAQSTGTPFWPEISRDGRFAAFRSNGSDLTTECGTATSSQIYVRDLQAGTTECVSLDPSGGPADASSDQPFLSADGGLVTFYSSALDLDPVCATATDEQVYVHDRATDVTTCESVDPTGTEPADDNTYFSQLSGDGRFLTFLSAGLNIAEPCPGTTGYRPQMYRRDLDAGVTVCVSVDSAGLPGSGGALNGAPVSDDGRSVAFISASSNLVPGDTNGAVDVFVRDPEGGATLRVSGASVQPDGATVNPALSADGRYLVFASDATNLVPGDTNGARDIFRKDQLTGDVVRVSVGAAAVEADAESRAPTVSGEGRYVAFVSDATNLVPADGNGVADVFVRDTQLGITLRASLGAAFTEANATSRSPDISGNGRYVAFESDATNLAAACPAAGPKVFVRDLLGGTSCFAPLGAGVPAEDPSITGGGRYVALELVIGGTCAGGIEVAVWDRQTGATTCAGVGDDPEISADSTHVAYSSPSAVLDPACTSGIEQVFVVKLATGAAECVSVDPAGVAGNNLSEHPTISDDGSHVAFSTLATNLDPAAADTNVAADIIVRDRGTDRSARLSTDLLFAPSNDASDRPALSGDDSLAAFESDASNLVPGDSLGQRDVFLRSTRIVDLPAGPAAPLPRGATVVRSLLGTGFRTDTVVSVAGSGDVTVDAVTYVSSTRLDVTLTASPSATTGVRSLTALNPGPAWNTVLGAADTCNCLNVT